MRFLAKHFILDVWHGSQITSELSNSKLGHTNLTAVDLCNHICQETKMIAKKSDMTEISEAAENAQDIFKTIENLFRE